MKKVDYKTRLIHALAVSGLVLGGLGAVAPAAIQTFQAQAESAVLPDSSTARTITIHKFDGGTSTTAATGTTNDAANVTSSRHPLANIAFTVVKITPTDGAKNMVASEASTYTTSTTTQTVTTDATGVAVAALGSDTTADGYYLVSEVKSASVKAAAAPFIVHVPMTQTAQTADDDATLLYDVNVYPKNETEDIKLNPVKTFTNSEQTKSIMAGADVSWDLSISTPADLYTAADEAAGTKEVFAQSLIISDPINTQSLQFKQVDKVTLVGGAADGTSLSKDTDYTVTAKAGTGALKDFNVVQISLLPAGMKKAAGSTNIVATLTTATLTSDRDSAIGAAKVTNSFDTFYTPATGVPDHETTVPGGDTKPETKPDEPNVPKDDDKNPTIQYGNIDVLKVDDTKAATPLANATFRLATSEANAKAGKWLEDGAGNVITKTTGADGTLEFDGLAVDKQDDGTYTKTYYLVETDAPAGYDVDGQIHAVVAAQDKEVDATVKDANNMLPNLPMTGSDARLLLLTATALIVGSGAMLYIKRRREAAQD
ncbi:SpaH/EbpB family LPXTG-anchored major pilin [Lacticaseibacillus absianus]|uniref:SpaH/EbpB family LPXTG-anchored major pilin n=1 Tax=Lacticaseibacillus absianus TaxID=2729623 RepID=UPI0015C7224A|nr:SpaH/EbpB family LPXTG-anchored major pilin [Lacticaseibacillus absianus]